MKKCAILWILLAAALAGCRRAPAPGPAVLSPPQKLQNTHWSPPGHTDSAKILENIWDNYGKEQRFSVYGGPLAHPTRDAPGDLDTADGEALSRQYRLPPKWQGTVAEGACLTHLMNANLFTAAVFGLNRPEELQQLAAAWRNSLQNSHWLDGVPEELLLVQIDERHLLAAYGREELLDIFSNYLFAAYPRAGVLYHCHIAR